MSQHQWWIAWHLQNAQLQEHRTNTRLLCSIYYHITILKPYLVALGACPFVSYSGLLRMWPWSKGLDDLAGMSGKQVDKDQSGWNLESEALRPHYSKASWPYLWGTVNSFWRFRCSNEQPFLCHAAKLEEGKGPGRVVQGENHWLKKGRARTFYASFAHGATARGHHVVIRFSSLPS